MVNEERQKLNPEAAGAGSSALVCTLLKVQKVQHLPNIMTHSMWNPSFSGIFPTEAFSHSHSTMYVSFFRLLDWFVECFDMFLHFYQSSIGRNVSQLQYRLHATTCCHSVSTIYLLHTFSTTRTQLKPV